jgi:HAD superfamily hydrolase (TIGR01509 family)
MSESGAVIFDCDGVLVDSERLVCQIESQLLTEWGWPMTPAEARATFKGRAFPAIAAMIEERLKGRLPEYWTYFWAMETANLFCEQLAEIPGVRAVIEAVVAANIPTCVASQSPMPRVKISLGACDLARYFKERVFTSSMVERPKPAPDLFLFAAKKLGVAPERCTVIEDSPSGVAAAKAANMQVFGYAADENAERLAAAGATLFQTMTELPQLLNLPTPKP